LSLFLAPRGVSKKIAVTFRAEKSDNYPILIAIVGREIQVGINLFPSRLFIPRGGKAMLRPHLPFKRYVGISPRSLSLTKEI
jgi:hypothetical protein